MGTIVPFRSKDGTIPKGVKAPNQDARRLAVLSAEAERWFQHRTSAEQQMRRAGSEGLEEAETAYYDADHEYKNACVRLFEHLRTFQRQGALDTNLF